MNISKNSRGKGRYSESLVVRYLKDKGIEVIKTNYTTPVGEVDIIAKDRGTTVFIEVKSGVGNDPIESVNQHKIKKLRNIALYYMKELGGEIEMRFDVITVIFDENKDAKIRHLVGVF